MAEEKNNLESEPNKNSNDSTVVSESSNNENVVEAMFEDAKELVVILGSLSKVGKAKEYLQKENKKME